MSITIKEFPYTPEQLAWLDDLETTEAAQGKGYLHKDDAFCCLGRACVVLGVPAEYGRFIRDGVVRYDGLVSAMSDSIQEILQLRDELGSFKQVVMVKYEASKSLVELNDGLSYTFKQIAAFIRSDPTNVFTNLDAPEVTP